MNKETTKITFNTLNSLFMTILYIVTIIIFYDSNNEFEYGIRGYIVLGILYFVIYLVLSNIFGAYKFGNRRITDIALSQGMSIIMCDIVMFFVLSLIEGHLLYNKLPHILLLILQLMFCVLFSYKGTIYIREKYKPDNSLVVYGSNDYKSIIDKLKIYQKYEFNIKKSIKEKEITGKLDNYINEYESIICINVDHNIKKEIVKHCYKNNIPVYDVPSITDVLIKSSEVMSLIDTPIFKMNKFGPNTIEKFFKRAMDLFGAILLSIIGLPFALISIIVIKLQDGGDIFFKQKRLTKDGKEFEMIKFRSMVMDAEPNGTMIKAKENDERITKYGKFMRRTRIDEIPQVINIFKGEMSFVGPRALRVEEYKDNEKDFPEFEYRLKMQAGLTGYAQIYGKYNTTYRDKLMFDMYYIENYSLVEDIKLILMTFVYIFIKDSTQGF